MDAYLRLDPTDFARFYDFPALVSDAAGDHVMSESGDVESYMRPFIAALREEGLVGIAFEMLASRRLGEADWVCTNRYRITADGERLIGDMEYHYVLVRKANGWRMKFARIGTVHDWSTGDIWQQ
jgi:hypothetical protein